MFLDQALKFVWRFAVYRDQIRISILATVLARIVQHRWQATTPELAKQPVFVRSDSHVLPGAFVLGATVNSEKQWIL